MPKGHKNGSGWVFCQDVETKDKMDEETLIAGDNQLTSNSQGCPQIATYNNSYLSSLSFLQLFLSFNPSWFVAQSDKTFRPPCHDCSIKPQLLLCDSADCYRVKSTLKRCTRSSVAVAVTATSSVAVTVANIGYNVCFLPLSRHSLAASRSQV